MLKSNNVNLNRTVSRSGKIYKKTNYLYTQPKLFNLIKACKERGLKLGLYTLFIPLFFFDFYKEYIASIDIIFICALAILNYIIRPAVNNNYIKNVSYHTDFKIKFLTKIITIMISSIYRLSFGIISEIGNMYFYNRSFDFVFNSTVVFYSVIASIIVILMFLFPRNLNVLNYHTKMSLNYQNAIDIEDNQNRLENYHNDLRRKYKSHKYESPNNSSNNFSNNNYDNNNKNKPKNKPNNKETITSVKKSDRRRRIF